MEHSFMEMARSRKTDCCFFKKKKALNDKELEEEQNGYDITKEKLGNE